jgi:hypothetical protein
VFLFLFIRQRLGRKTFWEQQFSGESISFPILAHENLRKTVACSFHKERSLLKRKSSHKKREKIFAYSTVSLVQRPIASQTRGLAMLPLIRYVTGDEVKKSTCKSLMYCFWFKKSHPLFKLEIERKNVVFVLWCRVAPPT